MPSGVASGFTYCSSVPFTRVRNSREPSVWITSFGASIASTSCTPGSGVKSNAPMNRRCPDVVAYTPIGSGRRPGQISSKFGRCHSVR